MGKIRYGARVVGEELAAQHKKERGKAKVKYGPRVTSDAPAQKAAPKKKKVPPKTPAEQTLDEKHAAAEKAAESLKKIGEQITQDEFDALVKSHANEDGYMSIDALKGALEAAPTAYNRLMSWELSREGGPRVGALTHLLEVETKREGGPRAMILQVLEKAIATVRSSGA